jgi:hypothetical protein
LLGILYLERFSLSGGWKQLSLQAKQSTPRDYCSATIAEQQSHLSLQAKRGFRFGVDD